MMRLEVQSPSTSRLLALASSVPLGQSAIIHTEGRNDMATSQIFMYHWVVIDPDGFVRLEDTDKTLFGVPPGGLEERLTPRFDLDKAGIWTVIMELLMNPDDPVVVDSYEGDLCTVTPEPPPEYGLIQHTIHPAAYVWEGEDEVCVIEFPLGPDQLPFTQWGGLNLAETFANAIEAEGNTLLEVKVYEDATPLLWTNYRVEITAAVASEEQGVAVWPWLVAIGGVLVTLPWGKISFGVLGILGIWLAGWVIEKLIKSVDRVIHKPSALTDEVIDELERADLIPMILYKAPRVDYEVTPEELAEMSDDGLRALLKELREEQDGWEWWPLALVGGVAVLGIGAAIALVAPKPKE